MGCVQGTEESSTVLQSPARGHPVLLGGSPMSSRKTPNERELMLDDALETLPLDATVTFSPYFRVAPEKREEWRKHCRVLREKAEEREGALLHRASFGEDLVHLRATFSDAAALLGHLRHCREAFAAVLELSAIERVEVHGPRSELEKVGKEVESIGGCPCALFELRPDSIRRPRGDPLGAGGLISVDHYFNVAEQDLPMFKCYHCAAFSEMASRATGLERHSVSFSNGLAHLSEDFVDAEAALAHLQGTSWAHRQAMQRAVAFSLEVHGPEKELEQLRGWLALAPAKQIEDEDLDASGLRPGESPCHGTPRSASERTAREAVAELLSKATMFDLGSRRTVPSTTRTPDATPRRPERKVLFADPPVEGEEPAVVQLLVDTTVALCAYFQLEPEKLAAWKECSDAMSTAAEGQDGVLYHSVGHNEGGAHVYAGFRDAAALLMHLQECEEVLQAMLDLSKIERFEVHAPRAELAKIRRAGILTAPLLSLFELAPDGLRADRPHSGQPGSDAIVSFCYRFHVQDSDLASFRRANCGAFHDMARMARGLEHHGVSFGEGVVQLRQGFADAHAALAHLRNLASAHLEAFDCKVPPILDVHGPEREVDRIRRWTLSASGRSGQIDEETDAAACALAKAPLYSLEGRAFRRTFLGRAAPAERRLAATPQPPPPPPPLAAALAPSPCPATPRFPSMDSASLATFVLPGDIGSQEPPPPEPLLAGSPPPPPRRSAPASMEGEARDEDVERFHLRDGRLIELRKGRLTVLGADSRAEADAIVAAWDAARGPRPASTVCGHACAGDACEGPVCAGVWCH